MGRALHELAQQALRVGKRVHASTGIDSAGASVVSEALADAAGALAGDLAGRRAVVVGAGAMGGLAAAHLRRAGAAEIVVLNRTPDRAARLAEITAPAGTPARAGGLADLDVELAAADVVVACTGAVGATVEHAAVAAALADRGGRPLVLCDLGLPRDVEPSVAALPGVTVIDLATLQRRLADGTPGTAVTAAQELVAEEAQAYLASQRSAEVTPTVTALRQRAAEVIDAELLRLDAKLPELDDPRPRRVRPQRPPGRRQAPAHPDGAGQAAGRGTGRGPLRGRAAGAVRAGSAGQRGGRHPAQRRRARRAGGPARERGPDVTATGSILRIGTRPSALAMAQTGTVADRLRAAGHRVELVEISSSGDLSSAPVTELGVGVFVSALREALARGEVDLAVHSYKDLPTAPDPRLCLAAVPPREDPRDALIARDQRCSVSCRPALGWAPARPRRRAQLVALGLGLEVVPIRGNVDTRIGKVASGELDAVVVAAAGLRRLGRISRGQRAARPAADAAGPGSGRAGRRVPGPGRGAGRGPGRGPGRSVHPSRGGRRASPAGHLGGRLQRPGGRAGRRSCRISTTTATPSTGSLCAPCWVPTTVRLLRASAVSDAASPLEHAEKLGAALAAELLDLADPTAEHRIAGSPAAPEMRF